MGTRKSQAYFSILCIIFSIFIFSLLAGCATASSQKTTTSAQAAVSLEPSALLKFADIPVPSEFKFLNAESYAFQSANFRAGLLRYVGKASGEQSVVFFKEQMPLYNWRMVNIIEYGRRMLSFEKEQESCIICIDDKGGKSEITISVAPKSQGITNTVSKTEKKPLK